MESPAGAGGARGSSESSPSTSSRDLKPRAKRRNSLSHTQKLSAEILRRLRIASDVEDTRDRDEIFRWLIADLAGEVESGEVASNLVQMGEGEKEGRFYQAIAQSLVRDDKLVPELLVEFERLWHHTKVTLIFALVFYKFLVVSLPASSGTVPLPPLRLAPRSRVTPLAHTFSAHTHVLPVTAWAQTFGRRGISTTTCCSPA